MMMTKTTTFVVLVLAACGTDPPRELATPPRTITGAATFVSVDEAGTATTFPIGLHETLVSAQSPVDDGWDVVDGVSSADGTFAIDGVAEGDYWLEVYDVITGQRQFLWTNASTLSFEERGNGRGDAVAARPGSTLTFGSIAGLDPVQPDDGLQLTSGNLGLSENVFGALTPGATTLDVTRAWSGQPLVSAAKQDRLLLAQLRTTVDPASGATYSSPIKSARFDTIEQLDGRDTRVTGAFVTPPDLIYDLRWQRSAFVAAAADVHPSRVGPLGGAEFALRAMPGGTAYGTSPFAALVLSVDSSFLTAETDLEQPFAIKNPYPASWLFSDYVMGFPVTIPVPGVSGATIGDVAVMEVNTNELPGPDRPIVPLVTPPLGPQIGGVDLFADRDGVGLTPILAWLPPAHGTPTAYVIEIKRWEIQFGVADLASTGTLIVPGDVTSVRIPAHVFEPDAHYLLHLAAVSQLGQDVRSHSLYAVSVPYGYAELITNTLSP